MKMYLLDHKGHCEIKEMNKNDLIKITGLRSRDIRVNLKGSNIGLVVRDTALIVNINSLKTIITHDKVLIVNEETTHKDSKEEVTQLVEKLQERVINKIRSDDPVLASELSKHLISQSSITSDKSIAYIIRDRGINTDKGYNAKDMGNVDKINNINNNLDEEVGNSMVIKNLKNKIQDYGKDSGSDFENNESEYDDDSIANDIDLELLTEESESDPNELDIPFEFMILETILNYASTVIRSQYEKLDKPINKLLKNLLKVPTQQGMADLLPLKNKLKKLEVNLTDLLLVLDELIDNNEDMSEMYLTHYQQTGKKQPTNQHEEVEELLETYYDLLDDIRLKISITNSNVAETDDTVAMTLDLIRNRILLIEVVLTVGTFAITLGALITGIFGMNLLNKIELDPYAFWVIVGGIILLILIICIIIYISLRNKLKFL